MRIFKNWAILVFAVFVMLLCPLLILDMHELADTLRHIDPSKALVVRFLSWILKLFTGFVWVLFLLFVADHVPKFAGWGLNVTTRDRRSINIMLMTVLGYAVTDGFTALYQWIL